MPTEEFINRSFDLTNVTNEYTKKQVKAGVASLFCANHPEKVPEFDRAPCELRLEGNHNASLVLGRDRNSNWASGMGGKGEFRCGMIDLVAGRAQSILANNEKENKDDPLDGIGFVGPMFHSDAARVYITQRCLNIDQYFGIKESGKGKTSSRKSAVAMKADHIRVIGREKITIYAGAGNFAGFDPFIGETNAAGERLSGQVIELQVGEQQLEPLVLGDKLVDYLKKQQELNRKVYSQLQEINGQMATINMAISFLTGGGPPFSAFAKENITNFFETFSFTLNSIISEINYLDNELIPGSEHILSNSVFTT